MRFNNKVSSHPRKQRYNLGHACAGKVRRQMSVHFDDKLMLKYGLRSIPVRKGDVVKVVRGSFRGQPPSKVLKVNYRRRLVEIEDATVSKSDKKKVPRRFSPSNLVLTKINLTDPWRRDYLKDHGIEVEEEDMVEEEKEEKKEEGEEEGKEGAGEEDEDDDDDDEDDEEDEKKNGAEAGAEDKEGK